MKELIDMSLQSENSKKEMNEEKERYPYGLSIHLDKEMVQKLGFEKIPQLGEELMIKAVVKVTNLNKYGQGEGQMDIGLQIIKMAVEGNASEMSTEGQSEGQDNLQKSLARSIYMA